MTGKRPLPREGRRTATRGYAGCPSPAKWERQSENYQTGRVCCEGIREDTKQLRLRVQVLETCVLRGEDGSTGVEQLCKVRRKTQHLVALLCSPSQTYVTLYKALHAAHEAVPNTDHSRHKDQHWAVWQKKQGGTECGSSTERKAS